MLTDCGSELLLTTEDAVLVSPPPPRSVALAPVGWPVLGALETVGRADATAAICAIWGADGEEAEDEDCVGCAGAGGGTTAFCVWVWVSCATPGACDALYRAVAAALARFPISVVLKT